MILKMAIRNIAKYKRRNLIVFFALVFSITIFAFANGFINGFKDMTESSTFKNIGHITIYKQGYNKKADVLPVNVNISSPEKLVESIKDIKGVKSIHKEIKTYAIADSNKTSRNIIIRAIEADKAETANNYRSSLKKGSFIKGNGEVVIGKILADNIGANIGDKLKITTFKVSGEVALAELSVVGIFETNKEPDDSMVVLTNLKSFQKTIGANDSVTEISIMLDDYRKTKEPVDKIKNIIGTDTYEIFTWAELNEDLYSISATMDMLVFVLLIILILVVSTGIINIQLVSVFERVRDIGTLRSIGMSKFQVLSSILIESVLVGAIGALTGTAVGGVITYILSINGLDMGAGMQQVSELSRIVYPRFTADAAGLSVILGAALAFIGTLYPGLAVVRIKPVKALHYR